ncbi:neutral zinc metallopeptidase [Paractinoplanes ferrugineus]|uniref:Aminopeptidase n=1 Tax=Paractinoplanes ferrugineus TaxID=113564 RepID=A0A919J8Q9_9ACTN|nr:neutral zinc metallopeptidase [Actinoplanes ferrugineus]GIE15845.1 aminopeptidase [Actinoplanes ferrugineus]
MRAARVGLVVAAVVAAGCGLAPAPDDDQGSRKNGPTAQTGPSELVTKSLQDVERFWQAKFPSVADGKAFQPVKGGYHPYTESKPPPDCGGQPFAYQPNAFYCPDGDFIAWDNQQLIPQLQEAFGPLLVGVVMAHEYGHAIQARLGDSEQPTVVLEQQADCYAGAWLAEVQAGRSTAFKKPSAGQVDNTVAGILMLRDQPGTPALAEGAHGNAFDRVRALQEGVQQGVAKCASYNESNLQVTEVPFSTREEAATGGDLPYEDAINLLAKDAQDYWTRTYPELPGGGAWQQLRVEGFRAGSPPDCKDPDEQAEGAAFYCPAGDFVAFDSSDLGPRLHERIGDFAVGMLLGDLFSRAAQDRRGESTEDKAGQLTVDCLAGSWTNDLLTRDNQSNEGVRLSPGDLDEAVTALLAFGRAGDNAGPSAFDRIAAYRKGVLEGLGVCV